MQRLLTTEAVQELLLSHIESSELHCYSQRSPKDELKQSILESTNVQVDSSSGNYFEIFEDDSQSLVLDT